MTRKKMSLTEIFVSGFVMVIMALILYFLELAIWKDTMPLETLVLIPLGIGVVGVIILVYACVEWWRNH